MVGIMRPLALAGVAVLVLCALTGCSDPKDGCDDLTGLIADYEAIEDEAAHVGDAMTPALLADYSAQQQKIADDVSRLPLEGELDDLRDEWVDASDDWLAYVANPTGYEDRADARGTLALVGDDISGLDGFCR